MDGITYEVLEDKSGAVTDLPHDFIVKEQGIKVRYIKLTIYEVPYQQKPCISGLRVFGTEMEKTAKCRVYSSEKRKWTGHDSVSQSGAGNWIQYFMGT